MFELKKKVNLAKYPNLRDLFIKFIKQMGSSYLNEKIQDDTNEFVILEIFEPLLAQAEQLVLEMSEADIKVFTGKNELLKEKLLTKDLRMIGLVSILTTCIDCEMEGGEDLKNE